MNASKALLRCHCQPKLKCITATLEDPCAAVATESVQRRFERAAIDGNADDQVERRCNMQCANTIRTVMQRNGQHPTHNPQDARDPDCMLHVAGWPTVMLHVSLLRVIGRIVRIVNRCESPAAEQFVWHCRCIACRLAVASDMLHAALHGHCTFR